MNKQTSWRGAVEMVKRTFTAVGRRQTNLYHIEGLRLHERALRAGLSLETTLLSQTFVASQAERSVKLLAKLPSASRQLVTIPDEIMHDLTDGRGLGDLISLLKIPQVWSLSELLRSSATPLLLVAVDIVDPGNVGAMVRTGHASGIDAFIVTGASDPYHPRAVRTSMGSLFKTAVCPYKSTDTLLKELRRHNLQSVGTALSNEATMLTEATFSPTGTAVLMGNEYHGLPDQILSQLNQLVKIPMATGIDSLSVNAATAVILYEIQRQQRRYIQITQKKRRT